MGKTNKFHGMIIVSDQDQVTVKGHDVIEVNSADKLVCRYYDNEGNAEDSPMEINILNCVAEHGLDVTEANITGFIKRTVGKNSLLISESAIAYIQMYLD